MPNIFNSFCFLFAESTCPETDFDGWPTLTGIESKDHEHKYIFTLTVVTSVLERCYYKVYHGGSFLFSFCFILVHTVFNYQFDEKLMMVAVSVQGCCSGLL